MALDGSPRATSADTSPFVPQWTPEGRTAPLLGPLRDIVGDALPEMPGANILGDARPGGVVLWSHPTRTTPSGAKMPVLAIGERATAARSRSASTAPGASGSRSSPRKTAGRGHGALWDGLLGWLMRDPRFEPAQMEIVGGCTAGLPSQVRAHLSPAAPWRTTRSATAAAKVTLDVTRIDQPSAAVHVEQHEPPDATTIDLPLPPLEAGAYAARPSNGGRGDDAKGLRLRGRRRRMGRFAPGPAAARSPRTGHRRRVRERIRRRRALAPEAHPSTPSAT